jgi:putative membrane protein
MDGGDWVWGGLMMLVFWGGLIALVVFLVRGYGPRYGRDEKGSGSDAQEILAERFARGDITADEFQQRRRVLERQGTP